MNRFVSFLVWLIIAIICICITIYLSNKIDGAFGLNKDTWGSLVMGALGIVATGVAGYKGFILIKNNATPYGDLESEAFIRIKTGDKKKNERKTDETLKTNETVDYFKQTFVVEKSQKTGNLYFVTLKNRVNSLATNVTIENGNIDYYRLLSDKTIPDVDFTNKFTIELQRLIEGGNDDIEIIIGFDNEHGKQQKEVVKIPEKEVK